MSTSARTLALLAALALLPGGLAAKDPPAGNRPGMVLLPGGEFEMGDHHNLEGKEHPSDEVPIHVVRVSPFAISATETTNREYVEFLNAALAAGEIAVRDNFVVSVAADATLCDTRRSDPASRIGWDGRAFAVLDPLTCPRCGKPMRIVAFLIEPRVIDEILRHLEAHPPEDLFHAHDPPAA